MNIKNIESIMHFPLYGGFCSKYILIMLKCGSPWYVTMVTVCLLTVEACDLVEPWYGYHGYNAVWRPHTEIIRLI